MQVVPVTPEQPRMNRCLHCLLLQWTIILAQLLILLESIDYS